MAETEGLEKNLQVGTGSNSYKAVGESEVLNMLKPLFKKHKLIIFPVGGEISENNFSYDTTYKGETTTKARNITQLKVSFKIVDIETGESEIIAGFGNGADTQDKGSGKAFTYAYKTALSKTFMLFSGEDTDNHHSDDIGVTTKTTSKISEKQINRAYAIGKSLGFTSDLIDKAIMKDYKKKIQDLTKEEYDKVVEKLEGAKKGA